MHDMSVFKCPCLFDILQKVACLKTWNTNGIEIFIGVKVALHSGNMVFELIWEYEKLLCSEQNGPKMDAIARIVVFEDDLAHQDMRGHMFTQVAIHEMVVQHVPPLSRSFPNILRVSNCTNHYPQRLKCALYGQQSTTHHTLFFIPWTLDSLVSE